MNDPRLRVVFPGGPSEAPIARVGGKGAGLIRLAAEGLPVPAGVVLTAEFFEPWYAAVMGGEAWEALVAAGREERAAACEGVKACCAEVAPDPTQQEALDDAVAWLRARGAVQFAVRSSSPDEDLAGASFAGSYVTRLGVSEAGLLDAVRGCFASSLDARVLSYKEQRGFDPLAPRIAVVVQVQLDSDVAGVGFSINPLTNDYDEAVFDAAWGLGESVVSGRVSPDHVVVDKVTGEVIEQTVGSKERVVRLGEEGVVSERGRRGGEMSLSAAQIARLTELCVQVEGLLGCPVDIEWAWVGDEVYVLQARPITAWVPLPEEMQTAPGSRRRLYMDIALAGGLTINAPISPLGLSWMERFAGVLVSTYVGALPVELQEEDRLWFMAGGRMYQDLSNVLWLASSQKLAEGQGQRDALMAAILEDVDDARYRAQERPAWASLRMLVVAPRALWRLRGLVGGAALAWLAPGWAKARFDAACARFEAEMRGLDASLTLEGLIAASARGVVEHVVGTMAPLLVALTAARAATALVPARCQGAAELLQRGYPENVVVQMSVALYRMSRLLEPEERDAERLRECLAAGELPEAFAAAWRAFLGSYGWRGPGEVDLASPRYADAPRLAFEQLCMMGGEAVDPGAAHERTIAAREEAVARVEAELGVARRSLFRWCMRRVELFMGTRDTPKHHYLMFFAALRRQALVEGERLVEAGRLDAAEEVFDLTLGDIAAARADDGLELRERRAENRRFLELLRRVVSGFPAVIDSRGRILRPAPRAERPGELRGMAVSPGVVRGPVKVLRAPDEKVIAPGDVLIAHTTDPGWTPLFVNAAAIVLEVGGVLQHGAVVAREYGKPCVAGIEGVLGRFEDGDLVEVDGDSGVIRRVEGEP